MDKLQVSDENFVAFMGGYCEPFEDLPDGAWFEACKQGVKAWNEETGDCKDHISGVLLWLKKRASESNLSKT